MKSLHHQRHASITLHWVWMKSCWIWKICHCTLGNHNDDFNMRWRQIFQQISLFKENIHLFNDVIHVYSWLVSWKKQASVPYLMNFSCWKCADDGCLGTMVSLLIGLLYASLQLPLDNRKTKNSQNVCLSQIRENIFPRKFLLIQYAEALKQSCSPPYKWSKRLDRQPQTIQA